MTAQTNDAQWYIARDGKQHGPLTDVEMRTFVGHSYLRPSDLLWRPGMADWQPAPQVFPQAFQQPAPTPAAPPVQQQPAAQRPQQGPAAFQPAPAQAAAQAALHGKPQGPAHAPAGHGGQRPQGGQAPAGQGQPAPIVDDYSDGQFEEERPRKGFLRQAAIALAVVTIIGGGAYGIVKYKDALVGLVSGPPKKPAPTVASEQPQSPAPNEQPSLPEPEVTGPDASQIAGSAIDARLQRVPLWTMLKKEYADWYINSVAGAEKLSADKKPQSEVTQALVQALVNLRRQNAQSALAASPEKLKAVASAFLENLRALQSQSVGACYGFISKGELSPAVVEIMQSPESATTLNSELAAIFEAASEGAKAPVKHESAGKADYDMLIAELTKLGWKDEDLQVFSNPRLLAKREPAQVCKMVQDWFSAHLAISDAAAQDRLLYETLKPVVSG